MDSPKTIKDVLTLAPVFKVLLSYLTPLDYMCICFSNKEICYALRRQCHPTWAQYTMMIYERRLPELIVGDQFIALRALLIDYAKRGVYHLTGGFLMCILRGDAIDPFHGHDLDMLFTMRNPPLDLYKKVCDLGVDVPEFRMLDDFNYSGHKMISPYHLTLQAIDLKLDFLLATEENGVDEPTTSALIQGIPLDESLPCPSARDAVDEFDLSCCSNYAHRNGVYVKDLLGLMQQRVIHVDLIEQLRPYRISRSSDITRIMYSKQARIVKYMKRGYEITASYNHSPIPNATHVVNVTHKECKIVMGRYNPEACPYTRECGRCYVNDDPRPVTGCRAPLHNCNCSFHRAFTEEALAKIKVYYHARDQRIWNDYWVEHIDPATGRVLK